MKKNKKIQNKQSQLEATTASNPALSTSDSGSKKSLFSKIRFIPQKVFNLIGAVLFAMLIVSFIITLTVPGLDLSFLAYKIVATISIIMPLISFISMKKEV